MSLKWHFWQKGFSWCFLCLFLFLLGVLQGFAEVFDRGLDLDLLNLVCILNKSVGSQHSAHQVKRVARRHTNEALPPPICSSSSFNSCCLISKSLMRFLVFTSSCISPCKFPCPRTSLALPSISNNSCTWNKDLSCSWPSHCLVFWGGRPGGYRPDANVNVWNVTRLAVSASSTIVLVEDVSNGFFYVLLVPDQGAWYGLWTLLPGARELAISSSSTRSWWGFCRPHHPRRRHWRVCLRLQFLVAVQP